MKRRQSILFGVTREPEGEIPQLEPRIGERLKITKLDHYFPKWADSESYCE